MGNLEPRASQILPRVHTAQVVTLRFLRDAKVPLVENGRLIHNEAVLGRRDSEGCPAFNARVATSHCEDARGLRVAIFAPGIGLAPAGACCGSKWGACDSVRLVWTKVGTSFYVLFVGGLAACLVDKGRASSLEGRGMLPHFRRSPMDAILVHGRCGSLPMLGDVAGSVHCSGAIWKGGGESREHFLQKPSSVRNRSVIIPLVPRASQEWSHCLPHDWPFEGAGSCGAWPSTPPRQAASSTGVATSSLLACHCIG